MTEVNDAEEYVDSNERAEVVYVRFEGRPTNYCHLVLRIELESEGPVAALCGIFAADFVGKKWERLKPFSDGLCPVCAMAGRWRAVSG